MQCLGGGVSLHLLAVCFARHPQDKRFLNSIRTNDAGQEFSWTDGSHLSLMTQDNVFKWFCWWTYLWTICLSVRLFLTNTVEQRWPERKTVARGNFTCLDPLVKLTSWQMCVSVYVAWHCQDFINICPVFPKMSVGENFPWSSWSKSCHIRSWMLRAMMGCSVEFMAS